jgi:hypothetical protein
MGNLPNSDRTPIFVDFYMNSQNKFAEFGYCMDVKYGGVLIQLQQDLEMEREGLDYGV